MMKKIQFLLLGITLFLLAPTHVKAQAGVSINIGQQPLWGPVEHDYVEYYYLPEHDLYYYAPQRQFVYLKGNNWVRTTSLPTQYSHVNLFNTYKVVINEPKPYLNHTYYSNHYKKYKGQHSKQALIRDSKDPKYAKNKNQGPVGNYKAVKSKQKNVQPKGTNIGKGGKSGKGNKKH